MLCLGFCKAPRLTRIGRTILACVVVLVGLLFAGSVLAIDDPGCPGDMAGQGTSEAPCLITNWDELQAMGDALDVGLYFQLGNDLTPDTDGYADQVKNADGLVNGQGWAPLSSSDADFTLNGNNHTISGIEVTVTGGGDLGLFGDIGHSDGQGKLIRIKNLSIVNAVISVTGSSRTGILAGNIKRLFMLDNIHVQGSVTANSTETGGLVGRIQDAPNVGASTIENVSADVFVDVSAGTVGGLIGELNQSLTISDSWSAGSVNGTASRIGGLIGRVRSPVTIERSFSTAVVNDPNVNTSVNIRTGGLIGELHTGSEVIESFSTGNVVGTYGVGGLIGRARGNATITNSYATGNVHATSTSSGPDAGGLVGELDSGVTVTNSYATGEVTVSRAGYQGGGLVGESGATINNSFWNTDANPDFQGTGGETPLSADPPGLIGKTTAELTTFSTFEDAGWSIIEGWQPPNNPVWGICEGANDNYPFLLWQFDENPCATPPPPEPVPVNHPLFLLLLGLLTFGLTGGQLRRRLANQA